MDSEEIKRLIRRKEAEDSLRQEFEQTLSERVSRYLQIGQADIIPNQFFASASTECIFLFRDGHFYGCIELVQAVAEAIVRFLCEKNGWPPANEFKENIGKLSERGFIPDRLKECFLKIWDNRDSYHHLNPSILRDRHWPI